MNAINTSLSALNAMQTKMDIIANNIANAQTPHFQEQSVQLAEVQGGGVTVKSITPSNNINNKNINSINTPSASGSNTSLLENNNVNLTEQLVDLKQTELTYMANAKVIKTQDRMLGSLLNIFV